MAILVDENTKLAIAGLTGRQGRFHGKRNKDYGTDLVAGVTPGKEGEEVEGVPVFNTMHKAVAETGANTAMVFVPPPFAADAIYEAADAGIGTIICITEGIPAHDMLRVYNYLQGTDSRLIGPNCPGVLSPGKANVGHHSRGLLLRPVAWASCRARERSRTRSATSWPSSASATRRSSASAATR